MEFNEEYTYEECMKVFAWYHLTGGKGEYSPEEENS